MPQAADGESKINKKDLQRLDRILGLLGSEHAGERASAALAADTLLKKHKLSWQDVLGGGLVQGPVRRDVDPTLLEAAQSRLRQARGHVETLERQVALLKRQLETAKSALAEARGASRLSKSYPAGRPEASTAKESEMKYLLLVHLDAERMAGQTPAEWSRLDRDSLAYDRELEQRGHYLASAALADPADAVIVRREGESFATTDGPFAETREHLGGFILIEARDLNEAIAIAARVPVGRFGAIEVRPVMTIEPDKR